MATPGRAVTVRVRRPNARPLLVPLLIGGLGLTISLIGIGAPSIWYDEAATVSSSMRSWSQLWLEIGNVDAVHALYYAGMHLVFDLFGYSPVSLRVPSALAVGAAAALTVIIGRQLGTGQPGTERLAAVAGIVFCLLPRTTWMGGEGRSYALTATLAALLTVALIAGIRSGSRGWWVAYAAIAVVSCVTFIYLALIVVAHAATMVVWRSHHREAGQALRRWLVAGTAAALVLIPFAVVAVGQTGQLYWLKPISDVTPRQVFLEQWFLTSAPFAIVGWVLLAIGAVVLVRRPAPRLPALVLLPAMALPTIMLLVVTAGITPIYTPRYLSMCTPFVALVVAYAITAVRKTSPVGAARAAALTAAALVLITVIAVPQIVEQRQPLAKEGSSWSDVSDLIGRQRKADGEHSTTAIIYGWVQRHPLATSRVIAYSYPTAFEGTIDVTLRTPAARTGQLWETQYPLAEALAPPLNRLADADVTYLITSVERDVRPETTATLADAGWHLTQEWHLPRVNVLRFARGD